MPRMRALQGVRCGKTHAGIGGGRQPASLPQWAKMKARFFIFLALAAVIGLLAWLGVVFAQLRSVPSDKFRDALRTQSHVTIDELHTGPSGRLPLWLRIRFPEHAAKGATGFPERTDVYTLNTGAGVFQCIAYVRWNQVCYVTVNGKGRSDEFTAAIQNLFPGLTVR